MEIEITPKIEAWVRVATTTGGANSPSDAIEMLIDATIDSDTALPVKQLRKEIQKGVESGSLPGDLRTAVGDIFAAARRRHSPE